MPSSTSAFVWLWIIEALASSKKVDASILKELVKKVPDITSDSGKDAREMIYFKLLDTLASQQVGRNGSVSPAPLSENRFNPSESCEDVVTRLLHERTDDAEKFQLQLQNFVRPKIAALPKCTLQKLKDGILEGKHQAFLSLKERSGLSTSSESDRATSFRLSQIQAKGKGSTSPNTENLNGQTVAKGIGSTSPNSENLHGQTVTKVNKTSVNLDILNGQTVPKGKNLILANLQNLNGQTVVKETNSTSPNSENLDVQTVPEGKKTSQNAENLIGQTVAKGQKSTSPNAENLNGCSQENCEHIILTPSKRDTCERRSEEQALRSHNDSSHPDSGVDTHLPVTKKLKHNTSLHGQAVSHERPGTVGDKASEALCNEVELNPSMNEKRKDGENYYADMGASNTVSAPLYQAHKSTCYETNTISEKSRPIPSKGVSHVESHPDTSSRESRRATDVNLGQKCSSGNDGCQDERAHNLIGQTVAKGKKSTSPNAENLNGSSQENCEHITLTPSKRVTCEIRSKDRALWSLNDPPDLDSGVDTNIPVAKKLKHNTFLHGQAVSHDAATVREKSAEVLHDERKLDPSLDKRNGGNCYADMGTSNTVSAPPNQAHKITCKETHNTSLHGQAVTHECPATVRDKSVEALRDELDLNPQVNERNEGENCYADMRTSTAASALLDLAHKRTCQTNAVIKKSQPTPSKGMTHVESFSNPLEAQRATDVNPRREGSSGIDGFQDDRAHTAVRKCCFLSSQITFSQDSFTFGSEISVCMKCGKGGEVLICSTNVCPTVVHERCLGTNPSFDDSGKFICPFCSCTRAYSMYQKIKEKSFSLRNDLAVFMGAGNGQRPNSS